MVAADLGAIALRQTQQAERRKQREQPDHYADDAELSGSSDRSGFRRFLLQRVVIASAIAGTTPDRCGAWAAGPINGRRVRNGTVSRLRRCVRSRPSCAETGPSGDGSSASQKSRKAGSSHVLSPIAIRRPDSKSSRCSRSRSCRASGITTGVMARSRSMISRASSSRPR